MKQIKNEIMSDLLLCVPRHGYSGDLPEKRMGTLLSVQSRLFYFLRLFVRFNALVLKFILF